MNYILGDGIAGYVIAACLAHEGKQFKIYGNGNFKAPDILLLKTRAQHLKIDDVYVDDYQIKEYFELFKIKDNKTSRGMFLRDIKIGYRNWNAEIVSKPDKRDMQTYLQKQERNITKSAMSDGETGFVAIDLNLVYYYLQDIFKEHFVETIVDNNFLNKLKKNNNITIWNTLIPTKANDNEPTLEYIVNKRTVMDYDYVYDCLPGNGLKRITPFHLEYFKEPYFEKEYITIKNYYQSPTIYKSEDMKTGNIWYDISRNATKTQLKIEDIISFMIKESEVLY